MCVIGQDLRDAPDHRGLVHAAETEEADLILETAVKQYSHYIILPPQLNIKLTPQSFNVYFYVLLL